MGDERLLSGIEAVEKEVASAILEHHPYEFEVVYAALEQILRGFNEFANQKENLDDKLESAQFLLTVRSFNSLRVAIKILENGYTQQALALIRTVMEDQLVVNDLENHAPTLGALLDDADKMRDRQFTFGKMAQRESLKTKKAWDHSYGFASSFAAHPRKLSLRKLFAVDPNGKIILKPGSHYDRVEVNTVIFTH